MGGGREANDQVESNSSSEDSRKEIPLVGLQAVIIEAVQLYNRLCDPGVGAEHVVPQLLNGKSLLGYHPDLKYHNNSHIQRGSDH